MSLVPAFEIGIWNAWIVKVFAFLILGAPNISTSKEEKEWADRGSESAPLNKLRSVWLFPPILSSFLLSLYTLSSCH